ncbi:uncharacterized protein DUF1811 [Sinobaca qinghaiensis]|uniref:Uncharacterized protein DUF1811 n=1 Tax=Sinobaca qinghaiensis TaxID=342944 RepID=A0A419UZE5_9BACL|nr:YfhH family protein [Sinobaca qinghaiensis]RKD71053.1 uncharacterized protein DUF1811 [Sinobaca qinghaiensis]
MEKRYSQMTEHEIRTAIAELNEKAKKAEQMGMVSELAVYERKKTLAEAYMVNPEAFSKGSAYEVKNEDTTFYIDYFNGVFAWGFRKGSEELEALPLSLLGNEVEQNG